MHKFGYSYMHSGAISYELKGGATAASPPKSAPATDIWLSFVFYNEGIYELAEQMQLSDEIAIYNDLEGASVPALCFYLKGYDDLCRHIWRFSFFFSFCKTFHPSKTQDENDLRSVSSSRFKIQSQFALPSKA